MSPLRGRQMPASVKKRVFMNSEAGIWRWKQRELGGDGCQLRGEGHSLAP